jgi:putative aldouronate transport system permease protein
MKTAVSQKIFLFFNISFMLVLIIITVYPLYYSLVASFSDPRRLLAHSGPLLLPLAEMTLEGFKYTLASGSIVRGIWNTVFYVLSGTAISLALTVMAAYVVSKKFFLIHSGIMKLMLIPMFFSGGIIPLYFVVRGVGILNTRWAMILPWAVSTYNIIITRTFFMGIPDSLEESAVIDGASDLRVMISIYLPLSKAVLAVITLYYAVGLWNSWYPALMFIRDRGLYPLQMFLREIIILNTQQTNATASDMVGAVYTRELIKYCTVIVSTVPILIVYPFLQKYFVKGVMIGAIKG